MNVFLTCLLLVIGLVLILKGGDLFVESSVWIARISHIKEMIIGATIVSVGTTLPELLTSTIATIKGMSMGGDAGYYSLAMSNAVGSMLANSGLILAIVLMARPPRYDRDTFNRPSIYVLLISVFLMIFSCTNERVSRVEGVLLLVLFILFIASNIRHALSSREGRCEEEIRLYHLAQSESKVKMILYFVIGALSIAVGAVLLVDSAKALAVKMGVSEQLLGVTLVAIGTSLPELVTSLTALRRNTVDIGVGNILGAHVINGTLIIGLISVLAGGIHVDGITRDMGMFVLVVIMMVLILPTILRHRFSRIQGVIMLLVYLSYMACNVYLTLYAG